MKDTSTGRSLAEIQTKWKKLKTKCRGENSVSTKEHFKTGGGTRDPSTETSDRADKVMSIITGGISLRLSNEFDSDGSSMASITSASFTPKSEFDLNKTNTISKVKNKEQDTRQQIFELTKQELALKFENARLLKFYLQKLIAKEDSAAMVPQAFTSPDLFTQNSENIDDYSIDDQMPGTMVVDSSNSRLDFLNIVSLSSPRLNSEAIHI